jgi:hypothetical protein
MRILLLFAAVLLLVACIAVDATHEIETGPPPPTPPLFDSPEAAGKVTLFEPAPDTGGVAFGYENTTAMTLKRVTVRCRAFDKDGFQLQAKDTTIEGSVEGPIVPGFKIRKFIGFSDKGFASLTCSVARAEAQ